MNFNLELNTQEGGANIVFNNIVFDFFKVNIVEKHSIVKRLNPSINFVIFKLRTLDDEIIKTKNGNGRVKIKGNALEVYKKLITVLNSYEYKNRFIDRKIAEKEFVDFILSMVVTNYELN